jgi:hypothetical protein
MSQSAAVSGSEEKAVVFTPELEKTVTEVLSTKHTKHTHVTAT